MNRVLLNEEQQESTRSGLYDLAIRVKGLKSDASFVIEELEDDASGAKSSSSGKDDDFKKYLDRLEKSEVCMYAVL